MAVVSSGAVITSINSVIYISELVNGKYIELAIFEFINI